MSLLVLAQGLLIYGLFGWKLLHLARAPRDAPLRWVVACLGCAAASYPFDLLFASRAASPGAASPGTRWLLVAQCTLLLGVVYSLNGFFLASLLAPSGASRRARHRAIALFAAAALMAIAAGAAPASAGMSDQSVPAVAAAYLVFNVSMGLFLADSLRWTLRGAGQAAARHVARGLRLISAGSCLMLAGLVPLTVVVAVRGAQGTPPRALVAFGQLLVVLGILAFLAGLCYPGAVMRLGAIRRWSRHGRAYRQLGPLWRALHQVFPQDALGRVPAARWREALSPWSVHRRYYRRVIECRDGLVRISPYLGLPGGGPSGGDSSGGDLPSGGLSGEGLSGGDRSGGGLPGGGLPGGIDPATLGEQLVTTLRTVHAGDLVPRQAVAVAIPQSGGLDADADELVRLSRQVAAAGAASDRRGWPERGGPGHATSTAR
ncbi:MAG: hypothetical protein J2P25_09710 [Nocardiopsaceae bacterium]|nr:hypothetical protein [Nocardiopsaceae bacterium]